MVHETLGYEVLRAAGVPAPRTGLAYVRVNEQSYGLYLNLETYDDISLSRLFGTTQHLYEAEAGEHGVDVTPGGAGEFEVDEGDEDDRSGSRGADRRDEHGRERLVGRDGRHAPISPR